eukprot:TRINITY_DN6010_c1_g2_i1.p1 TRINITY_DN6010_c1_g2~~TRINITY_DN6010_c1_g2_i1.p1  ORF type:complete len:1882 (+),score=437.87 TRINITY_DN6010_c1_g2_i1:101-5647(+)
MLPESLQPTAATTRAPRHPGKRVSVGQNLGPIGGNPPPRSLAIGLFRKVVKEKVARTTERRRQRPSYAHAAALELRRMSRSQAGELPSPAGLKSPHSAAGTQPQSPKRRRTLAHGIAAGDDGELGSSSPQTEGSDGSSAAGSGDLPRARKQETGEGIANWNIAARNFAVALVQKLERHMEVLQKEFEAIDSCPIFPFVMLIADFLDKIAAEPQVETQDDVEYEPISMLTPPDAPRLAPPQKGIAVRVPSMRKKPSAISLRPPPPRIGPERRPDRGSPPQPGGAKENRLSTSSPPPAGMSRQLSATGGGLARQLSSAGMGGLARQPSSAGMGAFPRQLSGTGGLARQLSATGMGGLGRQLSSAGMGSFGRQLSVAGLDSPGGGTRRLLAQRCETNAPQLRPELYQQACQRNFINSPEGVELREQIKRWESQMRYKWDKVATGEEELSGDFFQDRTMIEFSLWQLFKAIDHNLTGRMHWDHFVSYLIDSTMKGRAGVATQEDIKRYTMTKNAECKSLYRMQKLRYLAAMHPPAYLAWTKDKDRDVLKLLNENTFDVLHTLEIPLDHGQVVSVEVIPMYDALAISTADTCVRVYEMNAGSVSASMRLHKKCGVSATKLKWSPRYSRLYLGFRTGGLQIWDISPLEKALPGFGVVPDPVVELEAQPRPHRDAITDMLFLPFDGNLVTCSLDCTIKCLNPLTGAVIKIFTGHKRGVLHIAYSHQYNLLVSSGVEYNPLAWVINVPNSRPFTLRDGTKPHMATLSRIYHIPATAQCISCDHNGMIKIWDVRTLQCVQTIQCEPSASKDELRALKWLDFEYHPGQKQIITAAKRRVYILEYNVQGRSIDPMAAMDFPISAAVHSSVLNSFITCAKRDVKIWNDATGLTSLHFEDISKDDIRCLAIDSHGAKIYVGCFDGTVASYSASTGARIHQTMLPPNCEVFTVGLIPNTTPQLLLCVTADGCVTLVRDIHGDLLPSPFTLPGGRVARVDAKILLVDSTAGGNNGVFLIGEGRNTVSVWDAYPVSHGVSGAQWRMLHECSNSPQNADVTCLCSLSPHRCFVASDTSGGLHCWSLTGPDVVAQYTCMARWVNNNSSNHGYTPTVTSMSFQETMQLLYTGDDTGMINIYSLNEAFRVHLHSFAQKEKAPPDTLFGVFSDVGGGQERRGSARKALTPSGGPQRGGLWGLVGLKKLSTTSARLVRFWRAHNDAPLVSLQVLQRPWSVLSGGGDCQVVLWTLWGQKITNLLRIPGEGYTWGFKARDADSDVYNDVPWPHNPHGQRPQAAPTAGPSRSAHRLAASTSGPSSSVNKGKYSPGRRGSSSGRRASGAPVVPAVPALPTGLIADGGAGLPRQDTLTHSILAGRRQDTFRSNISGGSAAISDKDSPFGSPPRSGSMRRTGSLKRRSSKGGGGDTPLRPKVLSMPSGLGARRASMGARQAPGGPTTPKRSPGTSHPGGAGDIQIGSPRVSDCGATSRGQSTIAEESASSLGGSELDRFFDSKTREPQKRGAEAAKAAAAAAERATDSGYDYGYLLGQFDLFHKQPRELTKMLFCRARKRKPPTTGRPPPPAEENRIPPSLAHPRPNIQRFVPPLMSMTVYKKPPSPTLSVDSPLSGPMTPQSQQQPVLSESTESELDLPLQLSYCPEDSVDHVVHCEVTAFRDFLNRTHRRACASQRSCRPRPGSQPDPRLPTPLCGDIVSRGVCPDISTRHSCWARLRRPIATPPVPFRCAGGTGDMRQRLRLPELGPLSDLLPCSPRGATAVAAQLPCELLPRARRDRRPVRGGAIALQQQQQQVRAASRCSSRRAATPATAVSGGSTDALFPSNWLGWKAPGDGIAARRLCPHPCQKSWMVT